MQTYQWLRYIAMSALMAKSFDVWAREAEASFHMAGFGHINFEAQESEGVGYSEIDFSPLFLWREGERILIESALELDENGEGLEVGLEYTTIDLDLHGPVLVVGKMLSPIGQYASRHTASWVNRGPNAPLPYRLGPLPEAHLGTALHTAASLGAQQKVTGVIFLANGIHEADEMPALHARAANPDSQFSGGGRVAWFPRPMLELGASAYTGALPKELRARYTVWMFDAALTQLTGLDIRGEVMRATWSDQQFQGAWLQAAYRLKRVEAVEWLEPVVRFSWAEGAIESAEDNSPRSTISPLTGVEDPTPQAEIVVGLNAWIRGNVVTKVSAIQTFPTPAPMLLCQLAFGY